MGSTATHNLRIVVTNVGLDQLNTTLTSFGKTSTGLVKNQTALASAMGKTQGAAIKTGQEFTKTGKAAQNTGKQTQTLGQAFKSSSLMIAAFASSLVNTYQSIDSLMDQEMSLHRTRATLDKQTTVLTQAELRLKQAHDAGKITGEAYRLASEKLANTREILKVKEEQYADALQDNQTAWVAMATSILPTVVTAFSSVSSILGALKGTTDSATSSTNLLSTAKKALGTAVGAVSTALTPFSTAIKGLLPDLTKTTDTLGAANSNNTVVGNMGALNTAFLDSEKSGNVFTNTFKKIGTVVKDFFSNIKTDIGQSTGIIDKIKAGFTSFFSQIGSGFKGFGSLLKQAGMAVVGFGKALFGAIVANPILLAIAAISAAVLALITNFGGFRDMINGIGVAIGNAIPGLKGFLDWIGQGANAALDTAAQFMGLKDKIDVVGDAAVENAKKFGTLPLAIQKVFKVATTGELDMLLGQVQALGDILDTVGTDGMIAMDNLNKAVNLFSNSILNQTPKVTSLFDNLKNVIKEAGADGVIYASEVKRIDEAIRQLAVELVGEVNAADKVLQAQTGVIDSTSTMTDTYTGLHPEVWAVMDALTALRTEQAAGTEESKKTSEAVATYLQQIGFAIPANQELTATEEQWIASLVQIAPLLEKNATAIQYNNDGTVNWTKTIMALADETSKFTSTAGEMWSELSQLIQQKGVEGYKQAYAAVKILAAVDKETADILLKNLDDIGKKRDQNSQELSDQIDLIANGGKITEETEKKSQDAIEKTGETIQVKATKLGIWDKIQKLSTQNQENAIKITEEQNKVENASILTLQKLATARGLDISKIGMESQALFTFIATNNKVVVSMDDVYAKTAELIDARTEDAKNTEIEKKANEMLLQTMGKVPPLLGMTGKGLAQLIQNYDDMDNSLKIAKDSVGLWYSELQKSQKIEEDERAVLLKFAEAHQVTIPDAIKQGSIEGIKAFIEETLKMGPAAEKAKNELLKQFDEIKNGVQSLAEKQISDLEKAFGESFKAGKKAVKELGYEIDSLASKKAMVNVGINSEEAEDGIVSLREMMVNTINGARGDLESIDFRGPAMAWREEMAEEFDKAPAEVQAVFDKIIAFAEQNGGEGGTQYAAALIAAISAATGQGIPEIEKMFGQITGAGTAELQSKANEFFKSTQTGITNPVISGLQGLSTGMSGVVNQSQADAINTLFAGKGEFQSAGADLAGATASGYESGQGRIATAGENNVLAMLEPFGPAAQEAYKQAQGISDQTASGFESGQGRIATAGEQNVLAMLEPFGPAAQEAYAKAQGIATQTGQGLASGAGQVATGAQTGIVNPITGQIESIPPTAQTALAPIEGVFSQAFLAASTTASSQLNILLAGVHATADATNQAFSTMSTSVATYSKSMATNIGSFATSVGTSFSAVAGSTKTVHTALSGMSTSVKTYSSSMTSSISGFANSASTSFGKVKTAVSGAQTAMSGMSTSVKTYMSSMTTNVSNFATKFSQSMAKVKKDADTAKKSVDALKKSVDSLKDKSITIHVGIEGPGLSYIKHGGSGLNFPSESGVSYAAGGKSWIQKTPKKIGNTHVSEAFPEIITAIPLDPREKNSPFNKLKDLDLNIPVPLVTATPPQISGGGGGGNQPIRVTGNITNTIILPDGKVLANEVKKFLLDNFSGIT